MPDRLPSLLVLLGFWIAPAVAGWAAAGRLRKRGKRAVDALTCAALAVFVTAYAVTWFFFNLGRMPPYIPAATMDPAIASPEATAGLAIFASSFVLPGSALACVLAFRRRWRLAGPEAGPV